MVKMDIEGAEMLILENTNKVFEKLVYEWSLDIDRNINRLRILIERQKKLYKKTGQFLGRFNLEKSSLSCVADDFLKSSRQPIKRVPEP